MNQRGGTLIEMLVAFAIIGLVMGTVVPAVHQLMKGTSTISGRATVLGSIDHAGHWVTRDMLQAQTTDLVDLAPPVSQMTLTWIDQTLWGEEEPESASHTVTFTHTGTILYRSYDGGLSTVAARNITDVEFSIDDRTITARLTSSLNYGVPQPSVTRTYVTSLQSEEPI